MPKTETPLLTIVTITKNNPNQLRATVLSAQKLCLRYGVKHIVVDTSDEKTVAENRNFCRHFPYLEFFSGDWTGIAKSYNFGVAKVKSGWIWLLNASDNLHPKLDIKRFVTSLQACHNPVAIFEIQGMQSGVVWKHPSSAHRLPPINWIPQPGLIFNKSVYDKVGRFCEKLVICLDTEYWIRMFTITKTSFCLYHFPIAENDQSGLSCSNLKLVNQERLRILFIYHPLATVKYIFTHPLYMGKFIYNTCRTALFFR